MNTPIALYADSLHTDSVSESIGDVSMRTPPEVRLSRPGPLHSSYAQRNKGLRGSVALIVTIALHVIALAILLASRVTSSPQPMPITARVLSDHLAEQPKEEIKPIEPVLQKAQLYTPQPEIVLANTDPAPSAPVAVTHAAPKREEAPKQVADSVPRFDADYLDNPKPNYPPLSRRLREEGVVLIRVHVQPNGLPDEVELKRSSGSARLDDSALAAVKRWKFVPATSAGSAVAAWVVVPIAFSLNS